MNTVILYFLAIGVMAQASPGVIEDVRNTRQINNFTGGENSLEYR